jgi:hypothetical protein
MKKLITLATVTTALFTGAYANFEFGDVFKDLQDTKSYEAQASTVNFEFNDVFKDLKDTKSYEAQASTVNFEFGDVFQDLK